MITSLDARLPVTGRNRGVIVARRDGTGHGAGRVARHQHENQEHYREYRQHLFHFTILCAIIAAMPFDGLRVLSLESRRATEIATLIRKQGGDPFVAPS